MSTSNGKAEVSNRVGSVNSLVVIACNEYDHSSRSAVSVVTGRDSLHLARGPWSAHSREVVTIITNVPCMDTLLKGLEVASHNDARFYMVAIQGEGEGLLEAWSDGTGHVYGVGVDCDGDLPSSLTTCRDEARVIACTTKLAEAFASIASATSRGLSVCTLVRVGGGA
jgi:hypothetical protein